MSNLRHTRTILCSLSALRGAAKTQVRYACTKYTGGKRGLSLTAAAQQKVAFKEAPTASDVLQAVADEHYLRVKFGDGNTAQLPNVWLRDSCQCPDCFSQEAQGRKLMIADLDVNVRAIAVQEVDGGIEVQWSDGHTSSYSGQWLHQRSFTQAARAHQRNRYALKREPWGADHRMREFEYNDLVNKPQQLLEWLMTMERQGSALIKNAPDKDVAGPELIERVAYVKPTHYGPHSPLINLPNANNLAFTNAKLGLHNDLPQYEHMPGIIFLHCLKQHMGSGGESVVSDGFFAAEILRWNHPEAFHTLTSTDIYFWDKGHANYSWEMDKFYKISKFPVLTLNSNKEVIRIAVNHAVRDSHMDMPPQRVKEFYEALKLYNDILYDNAVTFKMEEGDIMTLDNVRCLHGREGYEAFSPRHIESSYLDWDETRCCRRRLQEELRVE